jgi:transglutaminase-like putative cysteine protease
MTPSGPVLGTLSFLAAVLLWGAPVPGLHAGELHQGHDAIVLEESLEIEVFSITNAQVRYLNRTQVLTPRGVEEHNVASLTYGAGETIQRLEGSVLLPSGKRLRAAGRDMVDGPAFASFELYSDTRHRSIHFPGVVAGSVVEHSYVKDVHNLFRLGDTFFLQQSVPVQLMTVTLKVPADVPFWYSTEGGSPEYSMEDVAGVAVHRWRVRDVPAYKQEPDAPPVWDLLPRIKIAPKELSWSGFHINAASWDGIARFYWELASSRMQPTPEVVRTAEHLTAGAVGGAEKVRRIYEFIQDNVEYVAISLGIGGYRPHPSGEVLRHRYGDCKDKATLMIAMMKALNLEGWPVLIRTRDDGLLEKDHPALAFNHAIVAIPSEEGYLFADPTSPFTPYGDLPWGDQGAHALVVRRDGVGDLVTTPLFEPERNARRLALSASVDASGNLTGLLTMEAQGLRRGWLASLLKSKPEEQQEEVLGFLAAIAPGVQVKSHLLERSGQPAEGPRLSAGLAVPGFVVRSGPIEAANPHLIKLSGLASRAASARRSQPVFFPFLFKDVLESRLRLPPGRTVRKLPEGRRIEGPGLLAESHYELVREEGRNVLIVTRALTVSRREIPPAEYPALRSFVAALAEEEARGVTLQPEG